MNNDEKILALLENMNERQNKTDTLLEQLTTEQKFMREEMSVMRNDLSRVAVTQENTVLPQLKLLVEGQETLRNQMDGLKDQIKGLSVIDAMQADISVLKSAVKHLAQELDSLKNAV